MGNVLAKIWSSRDGTIARNGGTGYRGVANAILRRCTWVDCWQARGTIILIEPGDSRGALLTEPVFLPYVVQVLSKASKRCITDAYIMQLAVFMQEFKMDTRYTVTLPPRIESDLEEVVTELQISKSEAFRRALTLLKHAARADEVILRTDDKQQTVLVK
jgi:hypothetical protein